MIVKKQPRYKRVRDISEQPVKMVFAVTVVAVTP